MWRSRVQISAGAYPFYVWKVQFASGNMLPFLATSSFERYTRVIIPNFIHYLIIVFKNFKSSDLAIGGDKMNLTEKEVNKAKEEKKDWEKKAAYWHNAIPNFNYDIRKSFTEDVKTAFTYEQLELNKSLSRGIRWNNRINIVLGIINISLFVFNMMLIIRNYS